MIIKKNSSDATKYDTACSFCLFRIPKAGGRVIWEITNTCNYKCVYCIFSSGYGVDPKELNTDEIKRVVSQLKDSGFSHLKITGGEPFIRPDIIEVLGFGKQLGFEVDVSTNASMITAEKAKRLKSMSIDMVHVSIDGHTKKIQESVRGVNSFRLTIQGIKNLIDAGVYVRVGCLIFRENDTKLENVVSLCIKLGVDEVIFSLMEPVGRLSGDSSLTSRVPKKTLIATCTKLKSKYRNQIKISYSFASTETVKNHGVCPGGKKFLYINNIGKISPCTWVSQHEPKYESKMTLKTSKLKEILKDDSPKLYLDKVKQLNDLGLYGCPMQQVDSIKEINEIKKALLRNSNQNSKQNKFSSFSKIYAFTTENILESFKQMDFQKKDVLTIGGSSDHIINAYLLGAKSVTAFDVNVFAKYYSDLKLEALRSLSFEEFKNFFMRSTPGTPPLSYDQYKKIRVRLSPTTKYFFDQLYNKYNCDGHALRESDVFNNQHDTKEEKISNNLYLQNKDIYKQAQSKIREKNPTWITAEIKDLIKGNSLGENKYDLILLSNLADYSHLMFDKQDYLKQFREEILKPLRRHLSKGGDIQLSYLYSVGEKTKQYRNDIDNPSIRKDTFDIEEYGYVEKSFTGYGDRTDMLILWTK